MKKIGVLRANALGDLIITLPALNALKKSHPEAELVLLGRQLHQELLAGRKGPVDRVIVLPSSLQLDRPPQSFTAEDEALIQRLREEEFDLIVQLHGGGRYSNAFINLISPLHSVGAKTSDAEALNKNGPYVMFQHEVLRQLEILQLAGVHSFSLAQELSVEETEKESGRKLIKNFTEGQPRGPVILLNPGAKDPRRRWPIENFVAVGKTLIESGCHVFINLGPGEEALSYHFKEHCSQGYILYPDLKELIGILSNCDLVISNDTGTMHLSLALKTPTVALFWYRNLLSYSPLNSELARVIISWKTNCDICGKNCMENACEHEDPLLTDINVSDVVKASGELLKRSQYVRQ